MTSAAPRKDTFTDMNDWLNALVEHRVAEEQAQGAAMSVEMAYVAETRHRVYQKRFVPVVVAVLGLMVAGFVLAPSPLVLLAVFVAMYFYVDFYSGILHVVLDNPNFVRLPLLGVPCVEFQWHHVLPYDISTRKIWHVWGDLSVLLLIKTGLLFAVMGPSRTALMVAAVGFFWAYANQYAHRSAHAPASKRPGWARWLQARGVLVPPSVHHEHHTTHDRSFPVLSGRSRHVVQGLLKAVPNQWVWLGVFLLLTGFDQLGLVYLIDHFVLR